jgi:hypothetical protein
MGKLFDTGPSEKYPRNPATPAPIGTGPSGETCGTCKFRLRIQYRAGTYQKCELAKAMWTHGTGSDIKAKWPACREWAALTPSSERT